MKFQFGLKRWVSGGVLAALALGAAAQPAVQNFPDKPLRFVVPFAAGSTTDQAARFVAKHITDMTKQPVIVDNRVGANGFIGLQYALTQPADGYTVVITSSTTHAANPSLFKKLPYDPVADFVPLTGLVIGSMVLAVAPSSPAHNVQELVALAKQRPGKLTFGSGNSSSRAGGEMFKELAGVDILHVPYKALPMVMTDVVGGQIDMVFGDAPAVMPLVRGGKLRALGVSTRNRMPAFDNIPTIAEQGIAGYELSGWLAAFAIKGTPPAIADKLNGMLVAIMKTPEAAKFFGENAWAPIPSSREEFAQFQRAEIARWARVMKSAGIEPE
ncbi:MAG: tripartite tricarboxylate transporter substrate binding protein [Pseudomonadota bacterium]